MITETEIAEAREQRSRLRAIATAVGLTLDEDNHRLMQALEAIDWELRCGSGRQSATSAQTPARQVVGRQSAEDMGDKTWAVMAARRGKLASP